MYASIIQTLEMTQSIDKMNIITVLLHVDKKIFNMSFISSFIVCLMNEFL